MRLPRCSLNPPQRRDFFALLLGINSQLLVFLYTCDELLSAFRVSDMFDADVHALLQVSVSNHFVDDNTNSMGRHVINDASATVVVLVRHTPLHCSIRLNVHDVSNSVVYKVRRQLNGTMFFEATLEHMARTRPITE